MEQIIKLTKSIKKLTWLFIFIGLIEIFIFAFITSSYFAILIGLITITTACISLITGKQHWKYIISILGLVKYNPFTFFYSMFFFSSILRHHFDDNLDSTLLIYLLGLLLLGICSFISSLLILFKTIKLFKLMKLNLRINNKVER